MTEVATYRCQWCQTPKPSMSGRCPARCDKPVGFSLHDADPRTWGRSRCYALTPLGWEAAGYVNVDGVWRKGAESLPSHPAGTTAPHISDSVRHRLDV